MKNLTEEELVSLAINIRAFYDYQNERLAIDGRLGQKKDGSLKKRTPHRDEALLIYLRSRRDEILRFENELEKEITKVVRKHLLWKAFLENVKGCGPIMAAVIITEFDIHKAPTVSNLWSFAGLAPGKDRKKKGKKCPYNQFLRSKLCGVLASRFIISKSVPYSGYYYREKQRLENSDVLVPEVKKGGKIEMVKWCEATKDHRHKAAIRKMIKAFLKDLYVVWRELEGLPVRKPYEEEYLGKKHKKAA